MLQSKDQSSSTSPLWRMAGADGDRFCHVSISGITAAWDLVGVLSDDPVKSNRQVVPVAWSLGREGGVEPWTRGVEFEVGSEVGPASVRELKSSSKSWEDGR